MLFQICFYFRPCRTLRLCRLCRLPGGEPERGILKNLTLVCLRSFICNPFLPYVCHGGRHKNLKVFRWALKMCMDFIHVYDSRFFLLWIGICSFLWEQGLKQMVFQAFYWGYVIVNLLRDENKYVFSLFIYGKNLLRNELYDMGMNLEFIGGCFCAALYEWRARGLRFYFDSSRHVCTKRRRRSPVNQNLPICAGIFRHSCGICRVYANIACIGFLFFKF